MVFHVKMRNLIWVTSLLMLCLCCCTVSISLTFLSTGKPVGETILYFGCRKKAEDFLYEEELMDFVKKDVLKVNFSL